MKPIGYDAPWLAVESDRPFEQWIVETWAELSLKPPYCRGVSSGQQSNLPPEQGKSG